MIKRLMTAVAKPPAQQALDKSRCSTATDTDTSSSERSIEGTVDTANAAAAGADPTPCPADDDGDDALPAPLTLAALRLTEPSPPPLRSTSRTPTTPDDAVTVPAGASPRSPRSPSRRPRSPASRASVTREMIERMRDAVVDAAAQSADAMRREALKAYGSDPLKQLRHARRLELSTVPPGVRLFQCQRARTATTRVLALAQLRAPIHEVVAVLSHRSALSLPLLNPGLAAFETLHTLVDEPTRYVAVKSLVMRAQWNAPHVSHAREFVVIESQQAFETDDGRRGWAVSFHSLAWPGCPEPPRGAVRGSLYNTGVVAVERARHAELIDIMSVAEFKLKGGASARADWTAGLDRALDVLALLSGTVEQRAVCELELLETSAFTAIERHTQLGACSLCVEAGETSETNSKSPQQTYRCRKCCVSVCGSCSATWRRGNMAMRLCLDCWGDAAVEF